MRFIDKPLSEIACCCNNTNPTYSKAWDELFRGQELLEFNRNPLAECETKSAFTCGGPFYLTNSTKARNDRYGSLFDQPVCAHIVEESQP